jgi:hypothetical protein
MLASDFTQLFRISQFPGRSQLRKTQQYQCDDARSSLIFVLAILTILAAFAATPTETRTTMLGPKAPIEKLAVTPTAAERMLKGTISRYRIMKGIEAGDIPCIRLGGTDPLIPMTWVENMLEELTTPTATPTDPAEALRALAAESAA